MWHMIIIQLKQEHLIKQNGLHISWPLVEYLQQMNLILAKP